MTEQQRQRKKIKCVCAWNGFHYFGTFWLVIGMTFLALAIYYTVKYVKGKEEWDDKFRVIKGDYVSLSINPYPCADVKWCQCVQADTTNNPSCITAIREMRNGTCYGGKCSEKVDQEICSVITGYCSEPEITITYEYGGKIYNHTAMTHCRIVDREQCYDSFLGTNVVGRPIKLWIEVDNPSIAYINDPGSWDDPDNFSGKLAGFWATFYIPLFFAALGLVTGHAKMYKMIGRELPC